MKGLRRGGGVDAPRDVGEDPSRLRDLRPDVDLVGAGELVRAAVPLKELAPAARQRMRARLRGALTDRGARPRRAGAWLFALRPAVIVLAALMGASAGGAAVYTMIGRQKSAAVVATDTVPGKESGPRLGPSRRARRSPGTEIPPSSATAESGPSEAPAGATVASAPSEASLGGPVFPAPPAIAGPARPLAGAANTTNRPGPSSPRPKVSPALGGSLSSSPPLVPETSPPPPAAPTGLAPTSSGRAPSSTQELASLGDAIRTLRVQRDPSAALALLDQHRARFPSSTLAPEVAAMRIEAFLTAGRTAAALAELDRFPLGAAPGSNAWRVVRGELRAKIDRWRDAESDFTDALVVCGDNRDELMERALWGRAAARAHLGNAAGAQSDAASYLGRFPQGRFAEAARRLLAR